MKNTMLLKTISLLFILNGCGDSEKETALELSLEQNIKTIFPIGENIEAKTQGEFISYQWKEGDKVLSTSSFFNTQHLLGGEHTITLSAKDYTGKSKSDSTKVLVYHMLEEQQNTSVLHRLNQKYSNIIWAWTGHINFSHSYTYSNQKLVKQETIKTFMNEADEKIIIYNFTYDENEHLVKVDSNVCSYTYAYHENTIIKHFSEKCPNGHETSSDFDENANMMKFNLKDERLVTFTYDEKNNLLEKKIDNNDDASVDEREVFVYDENSNLLSHTKKDRKIEYEYNKEGYKISEKHSFEGGSVTLLLWTYDDKGRLLTSNVHSNNEHTQQTKYTYTEENDGKKVDEKVDVGANDTIDIHIVKLYDLHENLLKKTIDGDNGSISDGMADSTHTFTYDANNNLLRQKLVFGDKIQYEHTYVNTYDTHRTLVKLEKNGILIFEKSLFED